MSSVADLMTTEVLALAPEMSLREAVEALGDEGVSGAPVVGSSRLEGVVSVTDIMEFQGSNPAVESPRAGQPSLSEELGGMGRSDMDPDEDPGAFFVDFWQDTRADTYQRLSAEEDPDWDLLGSHTISEVMTRNVISVSPDTSLQEAARIMSERGIHRVLVTRDGELAGILTTTDLVRAIAEGTIRAVEK
jgi:CBS domain-containing protein